MADRVLPLVLLRGQVHRSAETAQAFAHTDGRTGRDLLNLLSLDSKPVYSDIYLEMLSRLLRTRHDLSAC